MGFHEVQFPTSISYGSTGGPGFRTSIVSLRSGAEERIAHLSRPRHRYNVAEGVKSYDDLMTLKTFYVARLGPANGFRYKDWLDYTSNADGRTAVTATDQYTNPATGDGSNKTFQIVKRYINSPSNTVRTITKPVSGTVRVTVNGSEQISGEWTYPWSVDTTTGIITFTSAVPNTYTVQCGFEFDVPVRFGEEVDELLDISLDAYDSGSMSIPLVELFDEDADDDDFWYGGASSLTITADTTLTKAHGRVVFLDVDSASKKLILPAKTDLALGGPHFFLVHDGGANSIAIYDNEAATTVVTASTGGKYEMWLGLEGTSRKWYALS